MITMILKLSISEHTQQVTGTYCSIPSVLSGTFELVAQALSA